MSGKIGCTAETLRSWVHEAQIDAGVRPGVNGETIQDAEEKAAA